MSAAHDAHGATAHAHHDHAFDGEPAHELSPGEPRTPGWIPILGLALFAVAAVWLLTGGDGNAAGTAASPSAEPVAAAPAPAPPPAPAAANPGGSAVPAIRALTPEQRADLLKRLEEAKAKGAVRPPTRP